MENVRANLSSQAKLRMVLLCLAFPAASVTLYLGAYICAFMNSPVASTHALRDRSIAVTYLIVSLVLNVAIVWALGRVRRPRSFWVRCGLSFGVSVAGAMLMYLVIWGRYLLPA